MARVSRIAIHPIKSLDQHPRDRVRITTHGGLAGDREFAIVDENGGFVNGKRTDAVHRLVARVDPEMDTVTLRRRRGSGERTYPLDGDRSDLNGWLSDFFGYRVQVREVDGPGMTDFDDPGPTIVGRQTVETVASWFPGVDVKEMTRRLRPNLVVEGVDPFWTDRLVPDGRVRIGEVVLEARHPVPRCIVPARNPDTGVEFDGFRETFIRKRRATFPDAADPSTLDGYYSLMAATHVPPDSRGSSIAVGTPVETVSG